MCSAQANVLLGGFDIQCNLTASSCDGPDDITAVHDYNSNGNHDINIWGTCTTGVTTTNWCCTVDDNGVNAPEVLQVSLSGTDDSDNISFWYLTTGDFLEPHAATDLAGVVYGYDGGDTINGSDFVGSSYRDVLNGGAGNDTIFGHGNGDILLGEAGDDLIFGGNGADRIDGGDGEDDIFGNAHNDTICETSEDSTGTCTANHVEGNGGNNEVWLEYSATCDPAGDFDATSSAGTGTNARCGDGSVGAWPANWAGCTAVSTSRPSTCP